MIVTKSEIKTVEQSKALAFDCIQRIEIEQNNLRALHQRIADLEAQEGELVDNSIVVEETEEEPQEA